MKQLIWKDYRLNRSLLLLGIGVLAVLYCVGAGMEVHSSWPHMPGKNAWAGMFISYGTISMYLSIGVTSVLGGYAIACERSDRTANFLRYLPPSRRQIMASKFIVAATATAAWWGWVLVTMFVVAPRLSAGQADFTGTVDGKSVAAMCVLTFGVGWLGSACFENTVVPIIMAIASPIVIGFLMFGLADIRGVPRLEIAKWAGPACLIVGAISFVAGTWAYLRRVEP
jgi:ABC-type transport system involved in multi-copper enzyme maturation permease subunit